VRYPVACSPQAWAAASLPAFLKACLGLTLDHATGTIGLDQPTLPEGWHELHVAELRVGQDVADLVVHRRRGQEIVAVDVLRRTGRLRVSVMY
jgi:glycogen debranching enzyme